MECSLYALLACFSFSNLYLDSAIGYEDVRYYEFNLATGKEEAAPTNPLGRLALGYQIETSRNFRLSIELTHQSSLATDGDRGANSAWIKARWFPFR